MNSSGLADYGWKTGGDTPPADTTVKNDHDSPWEEALEQKRGQGQVVQSSIDRLCLVVQHRHLERGSWGTCSLTSR